LSARTHIEPALPSSSTVEIVEGAANAPTWRLSSLYGRVGEISGSRATAALTLAMRLVLEAQRQGEPVAWIARRDGAFYPPDVASTGIDLDALVVVWATETRKAVRAADLLVRSGAFGLVVLDLGANALVQPAVQARLVGLARKHHSAVLYLTEKNRERASVGALISIRAEATRAWEGRRDRDRFLCEAHILKDKRHGPGWSHEEICHGPDGLH
jgi:recombination protein RecA